MNPSFLGFTRFTRFTNKRMTPLELFEDLKAGGITLRVDGDKLRCRATEGVITPELRVVIAEHKAALIKVLTESQINKEIIEAVVTGIGSDGGLNGEEFTRRYLILMRAHQAGDIDDELRDQGIEFLLDHWKAES